jgi:ABC-2 type transport system permease protein
MTVSAVPTAAPVAGARPGSALGRLIVTEFRLFFRDRTRYIVRMLIPLILLVIFGMVPFYTKDHAYLQGHSLFDAYVPILIAYSLAMLSLTALPMVLASYREKGVLRRMKTTPAGPGRVLAAQLIAYVSIAVLMAVVIVVVARLAYGVFLPRQAAGFILAGLLAAAAMTSVGLLVASIAPNAQSAQAIGMGLLLPLMFFAGLFFPIPVMPSVLRHISHATPLGAAVQALQDAWLGHWPHPLQWVTMAIYLVLSLLIATRLFRWE